MSEIVGLLSISDESQLYQKEFQSRTRRSRSAVFGAWRLLLSILIVSLIVNTIQLWLYLKARQAANACKLPLGKNLKGLRARVDTPLSFRFQQIIQRERAPKRKCRDWNKLTEYVTDNSACFRRYDPSDDRYDTFEEFLFCPSGSPYIDVVEELRGHDRK